MNLSIIINVFKGALNLNNSKFRKRKGLSLIHKIIYNIGAGKIIVDRLFSML